MLSGYDGANRSTARGAVFWPTLDTRLELDTFSRQELTRRVRMLYANVGFVRSFIRTGADLVGWLTPQSQCEDEDWRKLAEQVFWDRCMTEEVFDLNGKFDFHAAQVMLNRCRMKDGDVLTVLSEWSNKAAAVAFYEAHQLANPKDANSNWRDGVLTAPGGRHLAYGLRDSQTGKVVVIPAKDVIYYGEFDCPGHVRAVPPLAHAVNHAIDITEVWGFTKQGIKIASLLGTVIEQEKDSTPRTRQGMTGGPRVEAPAETSARFKMSEVFAGGQVATLGPGEKIKILHDDRPSPEQRAFSADLIRDIAVGFDLSPEVVWEMGGLTGPAVRFVMERTDRWIRARRQRQRVWATRVWRYVIAKELKAGRLPMPKKGRWWDLDFTAQRSLTIDRGKESTSRLNELDAGVSTWADWEEFDGRDWQDRVNQRIREVKFAKDRCQAEGLEFSEVFRGRPGAAPVQVTTTAE